MQKFRRFAGDVIGQDHRGILPLSLLFWCGVIALPTGVSARNLSGQLINQVESSTEQKSVGFENLIQDNLFSISLGMGVSVFLLAAYLALKNFQDVAVSRSLAKDRQVADHFRRAIEMLGNEDDLQVRVKGIHLLVRLAKNSPGDYCGKTLELLTAFLRETSLVKGDLDDTDVSLVTVDSQAALTAITTLGIGNNLPASSLNLQHINLAGADLSGADLRHAKISYVDLRFANLNGANLNDVDLRFAHLSRASLRGAHLRFADLSGANLIGVDLRSSNLIGANLIGADLIESNFSGADLRFVNLNGANLSGANLSGANLNGAHLGNTNLSDASFDGTSLKHTTFIGANLTGANLIGVKYLNPSQVRVAKDYFQAIYDNDFRMQLGLGT